VLFRYRAVFVARESSIKQLGWVSQFRTGAEDVKPLQAISQNGFSQENFVGQRERNVRGICKNASKFSENSE
jgi:hypothetical protein